MIQSLSPLPARYERWLAILIVAAYGCFALIFSTGPIFEGPDEIEHYRFIRVLLSTGQLPEMASRTRSQFHQAPLYYLLAAPFGAWLDDPDFEQIEARTNPFYPQLINAPGNDNKAIYLHRSSERFPTLTSPTARRVHAMRLFSVLLGLLTVLVARQIFRLLWPDRPDNRIIALAVVALWPQFLYVSSVLNNDNLLFLLASLTLWILLWQRLRQPTFWSMLALGLTVGAALLTKLSATFLIFPLIVAIGFDRRTWRFVILASLAVIAVAGWWYLQNWVRYGDPTALRVLAVTWASDQIAPGKLMWQLGLSRSVYAYQTMWAQFGQGAVGLDLGWYYLFSGSAVVVAVGLGLAGLRGLRDQRDRRQRHLPADSVRHNSANTGYVAAILIIFTVAWVGALFYYASVAWSGNQGRYLLPGLAGWAALITYGLGAWIPRIGRRIAAVCIPLLLIGVAAVTLFGYFIPAYQSLDTPAIATINRAPLYRFGDYAEVLGINPPTIRGRAGEVIRVQVYWRALRAGPESLYTYLHSVGSKVIVRDGVPATGLLLASDWHAAQTWVEQYDVRLPEDATPQQRYPLIAGLYDSAAKQTLPVTVGGSTPIVGAVAITGLPQPLRRALAQFGPLNVIAYMLERQAQNPAQEATMTVCMTLQARELVTADYTQFVHLLKADTLIGQQDSAPLYPTSAWQVGEVVRHCTLIKPAAGGDLGATISIGWYDDQGRRLLARDEQGNPLLNDQWIVTPSRMDSGTTGTVAP